MILFPAKKGACPILNASEVHRARNEPKAIPARKEEIRNWGYSITNENKDFIRSLYFPLKLHGISGSTRMIMMRHITIIPAATKKINRHPKYSPTIPLTTREAKIPVSNPDTIMPTFLPLVLGVENCAAMGIKICGITEQMPVSREANKMRWI